MPMNRRLVTVAVATMAFVTVLVLSASAPAVRLWLPAEPDATTTTLVGPPISAFAPAAPPRVPGDEPSAFDAALLQVFGVVVSILLVIVAVRAMRLWAATRRPRLARRRGARALHLDVPDVADAAAAIDVDAAPAALQTGHPRNAIVACWMQVERDAASAGLPRRPAETSAEYVERVVAASSVDPGPIGELSALYREARFSRHEMGDGDRARASAALGRVAAGLRRETEAVR
jgi:Domain of unknown function (DUF4129)